MSKTLVGIVTFGNLEFTKLAVNSVLETAGDIITKQDILLVVGKPGDGDTAVYAAQEGIPHYVHHTNYGFPYSLNDIYEYGFVVKDYDSVIIMGNDVVALEGSIESLVNIADTTDYEWICGREISVKDLTKLYPETKKYFSGSNYNFHDFSARPWDVIENRASVAIDESGLSDVHNMTLFKKSIMDKVGYVDVNFFPAYFEDNDYARRAILADVKSCTATNGMYFHFWSRTIKQGSGGSTDRHFRANEKYYIQKWGGNFLKETYTIPFNGVEYVLNGVKIPGSVKVLDRDYEERAIAYWKR